MKSKTSKKIIIFFGCVCVLLFYYIVSAPCSFYLPFYLSEGTDIVPAPMNYTWPREKINIACYYLRIMIPWSEGKGVGVEIDGIKFPGLNSDSVDGAKLYLYIDGEQVSNTTKVITSLSTPPNSSDEETVYKIRWFPRLFLGNHTAKVVIKIPSGDTVEYEWQFKITFR